MRISKQFTIPAILGALLLSGVIYKLYGLLDYGYYCFMFQYLPERVIEMRYCLSIASRFVAIAIALGLIFNLEFYRRAAIWLATLDLVTLYWKHPYEVFYNIAVLAERGFPQPYPVVAPGEALAYPMFPWISLLFHSAVDLVFSITLIYFLTRPTVKVQFK